MRTRTYSEPPPQLGQPFGRPSLIDFEPSEPSEPSEPPESSDSEHGEPKNADEGDQLDDLLDLFALDPDAGAGSMEDTGAYEAGEVETGEGDVEAEEGGGFEFDPDAPRLWHPDMLP